MSSDDNSKKAQHGSEAKKSLANMLENLKKSGYLTAYVKAPRQFSNPEEKTGYEIYAGFMLYLANNLRWAVFSPASMRSDRLKEQRWDSFLLKKFNLADYCIITYPEELSKKELGYFLSAAGKVAREHTEEPCIDELDEIISQTALHDTIVAAASANIPHGKREDKAGRSFETRIANILEDPSNLKIWRGDDKLAVGNQYAIFSRLLKKFDCKGDIVSISAVTNIPKLSTGGLPKTDIYVKILLSDDTIESHSISCKNSNGNYVSAHQYSADAFISSLGINNEELKQQLYDFQRLGGETAMVAESGEAYVARMKKNLQPYVTRLCRWVVGGLAEQCDFPYIQCAQYLLAYEKDSSEFEIYTIEEYVEKMLKENKKGQLGTPFKWTYASGRKNKDIQLKMPTFRPKK